MGEQGSKTLTGGDPDFVVAYELARRVKDPEMKRLLEKATSRALQSNANENALAEATQLLAFWRSMPEHITGGIAIRQLETVLSGGRAPRSASAPKP